MKTFMRLLAVVLVMLLSAGCGPGSMSTPGGNITKMDMESANQSMDSWMQELEPEVKNPVGDLSADTMIVEELPDINSTYPISVQGQRGGGHIEIWAATEKSGSGNDGWINEMAEQYNRTSSSKVTIRAIPSGAAMDYILYGNRKPDVYYPSMELWGEMIEASGILVTKVTDVTVGNTAGILLSKAMNDQIQQSHGSVTLNTIIQAAIAGEITLGYTNPYTSSTALNVLVQMLMSLDPANPLSPENEARFLELLRNLPTPAYTTAQMRESARKGLVDVMVMEAQAYSNTPELRDYIYVPFGVRHDGPVYHFGTLDSAQQNNLDSFIAFIKGSQAQDRATKMGFNQHADYRPAETLHGNDLFAAQAMWKKNKSGGRTNIAVFVCDISGSMLDYGKIGQLQKSLINSMQYIGDDAEVGIVSYSDKVAIELPIAKFQGPHRGKFQGAVKALVANGGTHTYSGAIVALDMIRKRQAVGDDAAYSLFVLSDGQSQGDPVSEKLLAELSITYGVTCHTIGYGADAYMPQLESLASYTEGFCISVNEENVIYNMKNMFNAQM
jgi:Ca-activated chloride channel family protein